MASPRDLLSAVLSRLQIIRGDVNRNDRCGAFNRAWGYVFTNHLPGVYVEFGVYRGDSLLESFQSYQKFLAWLDGQTNSSEAWRRELAAPYRSMHPVRFIACDTFAGMPDNDEGERIFAAGTFLGDEVHVRSRCAAIGLTAPQLVLVRGLFADTAIAVQAAADGRKAAIVNLDGDLYRSAADALNAVSLLIQQGTVLLCDDYQAFRARRLAGERRALAEWLERTGIIAEPWFPYHFAGQAFLLHTP